jgi:glucose-6-phosphate isomerase
MFTGVKVNSTEGRPALHTALRDPDPAPLLVDGADIRPVIVAERAKCRRFVAELESGARCGATGLAYTDVVNIGIGGSDLGPVMAVAALRSFADERLRIHFASNVDGTQLADLLVRLDPTRTLFLVCSKTFTTAETLANARIARDWVVARLGSQALGRHFAAVSVNAAAMDAFGVGGDARFAMWDWVGGRYSLWSAVGLGLEIAVGSVRFEEFLAGGHEMDQHFRRAPFAENLPVLHGLVAVWNRNFLGCDSHAILPYDQRLERLPAYLQQLCMESNGKGVRRDGRPVAWDTCPVYWGEPGSNGQHSFFQLLHQGTARVSADFILAARSSVGLEASHELALANCIAQAEALNLGYALAEVREELARRGVAPARAAPLAPHKVHPGGRSASLIAMPRLDARALGALIALYEHSVYVQSVLWDINPFDQWGVELGKHLADRLFPVVRGQGSAASPRVLALLARLGAWRAQR